MGNIPKAKNYKYFLFILVSILAVFLGIFIAKSEVNKKNPDKIKISDVWVNNFLKEGKNNKDLFISLIRNEDYHIFYIPNKQSFTISITGRGFKDLRVKAEEEFLKILGVSQTEACRLNVHITTPSFANPNEAGKIYSLSFCE